MHNKGVEEHAARHVSSAMTLMPPPAPRPAKRKEIVLDEDDWVAKMEGIIERDFFPELGKLQDKVQWLEAIRSGDVEKIRQAQLNIAQRRAGTTPGNATALNTASSPWSTHRGATTPHGMRNNEDPEHNPQTEIPNVSLDTFLANHTSEDNASFQSILENTNKRRRERAAALLAPPLSTQPDPQKLLTGGNRSTTDDGFGTTGQPTDSQIGWRYKPMNMLMYSGGNKETLPLSKKELDAMAQGAPRSINHRATRLRPIDPLTGAIAVASPSTSVETASVAGSEGSSGGGDGGRGQGGFRSRNQARGNDGYDILATPSFEPGVDASPFMTWGDIEATPMRIEEEDLPPGGTAAALATGGGFKIGETPRRELKAHELAAKASLKKRSGPSNSSLAGRAALVALGRIEKTPGRSGNATPLSAAARRLAGSLSNSNKRGGGVTKGGLGGADAALRASYRTGATPHRHRGGVGDWEGVDATPTRSTGSGNWTQRHQEEMIHLDDDDKTL